MNRLEEQMKLIKQQGKKAFIPYLVAGDPDLKVTEELVVAMAEAGASAIELGIPYSDPVADGPVIQRAGQRALANGLTLAEIFRVVVKIRQRTAVPLLFMVYMNCIYQFGIEKFVAKCREIGIDGVIVPDLPLEESAELRQAAERQGVAIVQLVTPATPKARIAKIAAVSRGFLYCVAALGVTGMRQSLRNDLSSILENIQAVTDLPVAVGFGISSPEQAAQLAPVADGVIVGSAIVRLMEEQAANPALSDQVSQYVRTMKSAIGN